MKKILSFLLSIGILFSGVLVSAQDTDFNDMQSHWAKDAVNIWSEYGIVNGYDGNFLPDQNITRGDFATILNRVFRFQTPSENQFSDLGDSYYTEPILCLHKEGVMTGYEQFIRPSDYITREEAGVMLSKALKLTTSESFTARFLDEEKIGDWSKLHLAALVNQGFLNGDNGYLRPKDFITRAETVTILNNGICILKTASQDVEYDKICIIQGEQLTLTDCVFQKDVFLSGDVSNLLFQNTTVQQTLHIPENVDTVTMENCSVFATDGSLSKEDTQTIPTETEEEGQESLSDIPESGEEFYEEEPPAEDIPAESILTIETTLQDGILQKNSKKVFDVIARDENGEKIDCRVRCNGINIEPSWNDDNKTSFTLEFTQNGDYTIEITATDSLGNSATETYTLTYEMAEYGEVIGKAVVSVEAFTIGGGYVVAPMEIDVLEGVNCAYLLDELLTEQGLSYLSTGSLDGGFYLSAILDMPEWTPSIPDAILTALSEAGYDLDEEGHLPNQLSEFDFTRGSGWMYCVNNCFPNVGFSEYYLQDGDVMRIQFTLAYGSDIGGVSGAGYTYAGDFYEIVNRDELTKLLVSLGAENCTEHMSQITKPNLTDAELQALLSQLQ